MDRGEVVEDEALLEEVVPGDWVKLSAGTLFLVTCDYCPRKISVSQASLTGEAMPVEKFTTQQQHPIPVTDDKPESKQKTNGVELGQPDRREAPLSLVA
jgi:Mg2+-importing ATPase